MNNSNNNINLEEANTEIEEYSCPNCDGALEFVPDKQELCCKYCGFGMPVDGKISDEEFDFLHNEEENNIIAKFKGKQEGVITTDSKYFI